MTFIFLANKMELLMLNIDVACHRS